MIVSRKRAFVTLAVAATLASCGEAREDGLKQQMQRDVYKSKADCEKDWKGKSALCEKIPEQQAQQSASSTGYRTHTPYVGGGYWGPMYYTGTRSVTMPSGETVTPTSNLAQAKPYMVSPSAAAASPSSQISKPVAPARVSGVSRGGFGGFGGRGGGG